MSMNSLGQSPVVVPLLRSFPHCAILFKRTAIFLGVIVLCIARSSFAEYRIERIASGLNQPSSVAFAPGDNNTMYILERSQNDNNSLGKVLKYDIPTRTKSTILDLSSRPLGGTGSDLGAMSLVFHPDFNDPSSSGYQRFYLSTATYEGT